MADAFSLTAIEIKRAIIAVLESRPNYSCKYDVITKFVLKELGLQDVRGQRRQEVDRRVRKAVGDLKRAKVVVRYKARNERIKLDSDHISGMARIESFARQQEMQNQRQDHQPENRLPFTPPSTKDEPPEPKVPDIDPETRNLFPRLPDLLPRKGDSGGEARGAMRPGNVEAFKTLRDDPSEEDDHLVAAIQILTGRNPQGQNVARQAGLDKEREGETDAQELIVSFSNALSLIDAELSRHYKIRSDVSFDRLNVTIEDSRGQVFASVIADSAALRFSVRCVLPLRRTASEDVLRIASDVDFCSTPYILHYQGEERIGVRRRVNVRKGEEAACAYEVLAAIHDAVRVIKEIRPQLIEVVQGA